MKLTNTPNLGKKKRGMWVCSQDMGEAGPPFPTTDSLPRLGMQGEGVLHTGIPAGEEGFVP